MCAVLTYWFKIFSQFSVGVSVTICFLLLFDFCHSLCTIAWWYYHMLLLLLLYTVQPRLPIYSWLSLLFACNISRLRVYIYRLKSEKLQCSTMLQIFMSMHLLFRFICVYTTCSTFVKCHANFQRQKWISISMMFLIGFDIYVAQWI